MEQRYSQEELAELREEVNRKWREAFNLRLDALDKTVNGLIDQMQFFVQESENTPTKTYVYDVETGLYYLFQ